MIDNVPAIGETNSYSENNDKAINENNTENYHSINNVEKVEKDANELTGYKSNLLADTHEELKPEGSDSKDLGDLDITIPEGFEVDEEAVDSFKSVAKEIGLTSENAQKFVDLQVDLQRKATLKNIQENQKIINDWENEIKEHRAFGGIHLRNTVDNAKKVLAKFASPKLKEDFENMGVLSHPEFVFMLARIGKTALEGSSINGNSEAKPEKSLADRMYPNFT